MEIFYNIWTYVSAIVYMLITLITSSHVILNKRDARSAAFWVGFLWFVPLLGLFFYIFFGINRIQRRASKIRNVDTISATVSGFFLFNVFKEELPDINKANYALFLTGVLFFTFIHFIFGSY